MFFGSAGVWAACSPAGDHSSHLLLQHFAPGDTDIKAVGKREGWWARLQATPLGGGWGRGGVDDAKKSPARLSPHATGTCRPDDEDDAVRDSGGAGSAETHRCADDRGWTDSDRAEFCVFVG